MLTSCPPLSVMLAAAFLALPVLARDAVAEKKGPLDQAVKVVGVPAQARPSGNERGPLDQANKAAEAKMLEPLVVRMYNCQDLMMGRDYPYFEWSAPRFEVSSVLQQASQAGEGRAGLFGGAAAPAIGDAAALGSMLSPEVLIETIQRTIDDKSWEDEGGRGKIINVGALLVVTQTAENQKKIAELLDQFRAARQMVQIEVRWVLLDDTAVSKIGPQGAQRTVPLEVTPAAISAAATVIYRGHLTCLDRQKVHLATGKMSTYISDAEPVVAERAVGWDSQITALLTGAVIEITPALSPDGKSAMIDLRSEVTENTGLRNSTLTATCGDSQKGGEPAKANIDLPDLLLQTFRTTLRVPLDKPVLIGGTTAPKAIDGKVLYLLLEISASK